MEIVRHNDVASLLGRCKEVLARNEALNNNLIQLIRLIADESDVLKPPISFGSIESEGKAIGCYVHASPDGLVITNLPDLAVLPLCEAIVRDVALPRRVVGEPKFTQRLVARMTQGKSRKASVSSEWKVYRLDQVTPLVSPPPGELRRGTADDQYLVEQLGYAYGDERPSFLNVHDFLLGKLRSREMYFWHDNNTRTMITVSGKGMNAKRISSVFTPREFRGKGYATAGVASMSELLLAEGAEYVVLTAGLGEPAARIYRRIGFRPVGERQSFVLS